MVSNIFFLGLSCDSGVLSVDHEPWVQLFGKKKTTRLIHLRTRDLQNIFCHLAWSSVEAVLFQYHPLSHLWKLPEMTTHKLRRSLARWTSAYTKNHSKALYTTHICWFEVALRTGSMKTGGRGATEAYHANEPFILHLFYRNIIH